MSEVPKELLDEINERIAKIFKSEGSSTKSELLQMVKQLRKDYGEAFIDRHFRVAMEGLCCMLVG